MNKELLTAQEYEILKMLADSCPRKNIAEKLNISYSKCNTIVRKYLKNLMRLILLIVFIKLITRVF